MPSCAMPSCAALRHTAGLIVFGLTSVAAQDHAAPERYAAARAAILAVVTEGLTPALSIAVAEDGEVVWAEGFGVADPVRGTPATADTIYRLASISKPFTATALMLLADRGQVDLDAPANRYLEAPGIVAHRGSADAVTLRRLANHTAGLPTHWSFYYPGASPPTRAQTIARFGFAAWPPGTRTNYSNLAFGILDHVVARVGAASFREFLVRELLDPLAMDHTDLGVRPGRESAAAIACARDAAGRFVPVADYGFDHDGASAVRSSARDLMRFAALQIGDGAAGGRRLLRAESARAMRDLHGRDAGSTFGVGWSVGSARGTQALRHSGGMPGVSTVLEVFPEKRAAVAVLTNSGDRGATNRALAAVLDVLLGPGEATARAAEPKPAAAAKAAGGRWTGDARHADGPVAIELAIGEDGAPSLKLAGRDVRDATLREATAKSVRVHFRGLLRTTPAFHGTPGLELELERDGDGYSGVLYAVADATFRLAHWVELRPMPAPDAGK